MNWIFLHSFFNAISSMQLFYIGCVYNFEAIHTGALVIIVAAETIQKSKNGSEEAFSEIVEAFQLPVFNLCFRMLGEAKEAEDAAQETFWKAYQAIPSYDPERPFGTWLLSIAAHHCIDQQRKRKLPIADIDEYMEETEADKNTPNPESELMALESKAQIQKLLLTLPELDRAAIIFRYWHDYSEEEISQALDISISAVKSRLHRARRKLAHVWQSTSISDQKLERMHNESSAL